MESQPPGRTNTIKSQVRGKFEQHDAELHKLLSRVELVLGDVDIFHEVVREGVGYIALVELLSPY